MQISVAAGRIAGLVAALLLLACQAGDDMGPSQTMMPVDTMTPGGDRNGMGMGLGGSAETTVLAEGRLTQLTAGPLAWVAYEARGDEELAHVHGPGFVYAVEGSHSLVVDGEERTLAEGEAVFLDHGADHRHRGGRFWDIALVTLQPDGPPAVEGTDVVFASEALGEVPAPPVEVAFVEVALPPSDGQTAVHTHPGPEFIYVTDGAIEYQTAVGDTERLGAGDDRALRGDTAVQKRNPWPEPARFLSWFVVDPDRPFSSEAEFE